MQGVRDLDARSIKACYQNLKQQLGDLETHRFQGTMNEWKMKRETWIQLSAEIREVAKEMQAQRLHTGDTDGEEEGDVVIPTPVAIPVDTVPR